MRLLENSWHGDPWLPISVSELLSKTNGHILLCLTHQPSFLNFTSEGFMSRSFGTLLLINPMISLKTQPSPNHFSKHSWQPLSISTWARSVIKRFCNYRVVGAQAENSNSRPGMTPYISTLAAAMNAQACLTHSIPDKKDLRRHLRLKRDLSSSSPKIFAKRARVKNAQRLSGWRMGGKAHNNKKKQLQPNHIAPGTVSGSGQLGNLSDECFFC